MRYFLILAFALVVSALVSNEAVAEPEVYMVEITPNTVDNQQDEDVSFSSDCSVCNGEGMTYFYWNSSIDGVLASGSENHNIMISSSTFSVGEHTVTFQVRDNNSEWSSDSSSSRANLSVSGRDGGGGDSDIDVNFGIEPPTLHIGETATFRACTEMYPEPQPCVNDPDADLDFYWEVLWNDEGSWSYIGNSEIFTFNDLQEGTHTVKLSITYDGDTVNETQQMIVLPPIPQVVIDFTSGDSIKEGDILEITAQCLDNNQDEIECDYYWDIYDNDGNPDLLFRLSGSPITLTNLTNSQGSYEIVFRSQDSESGIYSSYYQAIVNVLPPNQSPTASILISPESLGGLTPQYYWTSVLTFSSSSNDPDGNIVAYKWYYDGVLTSEDSQFSLTFTSADIGLHQIKLEVQDNDGVWSSQTATGFKLKDNNGPMCEWYPEENNGTYLLISDCEDPDEEGFIVEYFWTAYANIDGDNVIIFNATGRNLTFTPTFSSDYVFTLVATDNGGLSSSAAGHSIDVKLDLPKNFIVSFGSKEIDVGDFFHIDFSETTGEYSHFKVKVINPNGTSREFEVTDVSSNFTIGFNEAGTYPIDVQVVWKDGTDRGLDDFYGPTVTVGSRDDSSTGDSNQSVDITEDSDELSSLSLLVSTLILSLIAVSRRQR